MSIIIRNMLSSRNIISRLDGRLLVSTLLIEHNSCKYLVNIQYDFFTLNSVMKPLKM